jgi:hypothetical protein
MRSAVIEGLSDFQMKCQLELQEEVERELVGLHQGVEFNFKRDLWDETRGLLRVVEFDDVSNPNPKRVDQVICDYQVGLLDMLEQMTALSKSPLSLETRIFVRVHSDITSAKLGMIRRGIKHMMTMRVQLRNKWPAMFEPDEVHYDIPA